VLERGDEGFCARRVPAAGFERGQVGGFADAFTVCAVAAVVSAAVALGLVPRGKPQITGGPHVH
jgi:negative regulator of sigma E activity